LNSEISLIDVLELPDDSLKQVFPKLSSRVLVCLLAAYPRLLNRTFMTLLYECMSRATMEFLQEEMSRGQFPSFKQIRDAESEFLKIIQKEKLLPLPVFDARATTTLQ
jgi:hypothetical protein